MHLHRYAAVNHVESPVHSECVLYGLLFILPVAINLIYKALSYHESRLYIGLKKKKKITYILFDKRDEG